MGENFEARSLPGTMSSLKDANLYSALTEKWNPFLKGIDNKHVREVTAVLLENVSQDLQKINEDSGTMTPAVGEFTKFVFPIVRRVWPNLIANNLVSVQPMTAPVGAIFYLEYQAGSNKGGWVAGQNFIQNLPDTNYSGSQITNETEGIAKDGVTVFSSGLQWQPVVPSSVTITINDTTVITAIDDGNGNLVNPTGKTGIAAGSVINYQSGVFTINLTAATGKDATVTAVYQYNNEFNSQVPTMNINISMFPVQAQTRKVKALWSAEAADDLRAFHGIDAEAELVTGVASEIALEVDREILYDLLNSVAGATNPNTTGWTATVPSTVWADVYWIRSLLTQITYVSQQVHKRTLRGPANWIVTSPSVASLFLQLATHGDFRPVYSAEGTPLGSPIEQSGVPGYGIYKLGVLQNRWTVYVDPYMSENPTATGTNVSGTILIGLKGASFLDTGYVYAPYIPLQVTPTFLDPSDFSFRKGLRTRYAKRLMNSDFFGSVVVKGLGGLINS
jgi:hypothetical protein